jgi:hypothetical protein
MMGKGNTKTPTVPRQRLKQGADWGGGGPEREASPCERSLLIGVNLLDAPQLAIGDPATIGSGRPPTVRSDRLQVGVVAAADAPEIEGCIALGFRFTGVVAEVDVAGGAAVVQVAGRKER